MEICSSYRCAVTQHKCTAALSKAECNPHCSVLLCKGGSQQSMCHCSDICGDCSSYRCAMTQHKCNPHCSVLLCKTGSQQAVCHCRYTCGGLLFIQVKALQHCSGQNTFSTVQCCSAKQAHSMHCVTANTPMKICSSNSYAVAQHQCTAALLRATCIPHCPVLLCKAGLQQTMCHCNYTCGDLLFLQGAVTQHKCTATLFRAKCNPHC